MLFVSNFNITLAASWMLEVGAKYQYLCTLVRGEALRQFDSFSDDVESAETLKTVMLLAEVSAHGFLSFYTNSVLHKKRSDLFAHCANSAQTIRLFFTDL